MTFSLWLKSTLVGTPVEGIAKRARWYMAAKSRAKFPELWELHLEEQRLPGILTKLLKPQSCGVDVGAHIGSFLNLLVEKAPYGRHTAIEASSTKARWLRRRFPGAVVFECAASDSNGSAFFEDNQARPGYSRLLNGSEPTNNSAYKVPTRKLDDMCIEQVDLLKMDIEGAEILALRGGRKLIEKHRPAILFECGIEYDPHSKTNRAELYPYLTDTLGYDLFTYTDFLFPEKGSLTSDEFRKCGIYPFRALNFIAMPRR
jgi:FkbM family methyltransferase